MKKIIFLSGLAILLLGFYSFTKPPCPNVEFEISFKTPGSVKPTFLVNGTSVSSSLASNYWSAYVDGPASCGIFDFKSNRTYTIKGIGSKARENLCVKFTPNFNPQTDGRPVEYDPINKTFKIGSGGNSATCILNISTQPCSEFE